MVMQKSVLARKLIAAAEIMANSHLIERLSPLVGSVYSKLRGAYPNIKISINADEDILDCEWNTSAGQQIAMATILPISHGSKVRLTGSSEQFGSINKICLHPRDVTYQIDSWLDL